MRGYYALLSMAGQSVGRVDVFHAAVGSVGVAALTGHNNTVVVRHPRLVQRPLDFGKVAAVSSSTVNI